MESHILTYSSGKFQGIRCYESSTYKNEEETHCMIYVPPWQEKQTKLPLLALLTILHLESINNMLISTKR